MKKLFSDFKMGEVKLEAENADDLWHLKGIIDEGDVLKGKTLRKVTPSSKDERAKEAIRKPMVLAIRVEKVDFGDAGELRVGGSIIGAPEDVPLGSHHTFAIEPHSSFTLIKNQWLKFQKEKLEQSLSSSKPSILLCVLDREEAYFALLKSFGYEVLLRMSGSVQKKGDTSLVLSNFFSLVAKQLLEYDLRHSFQTIIIASPAFWKEDLMKLINASLKRKIVLASCSSVGENGIMEVLRRPEVKEVLRQERASQEARLIEELLKEIATNGAAAYGKEETKKAIEMGAIRLLLVSESLIVQSRREGWYEEIERMMKDTESSRGDIMLISPEHEAGKQLLGLGGVGALLRFKMKY